jgi:methionine synthase II (cobalamin-independent)
MAFEPQCVEALLPRFEQVMFREVAAIAREIPPQDTAMQWDVAVEITMALEGLNPPLTAAFPVGKLAATLARCCDRVSRDVELGVHLCYGNRGGRQLIEPRDTANLTLFANELFAQLHRPLNWIHMPVPIARDDAAYFAPLADLNLPAGTELYLGLVHLRDGVAGAQRRIAAARGFVPAFGVGTECGMRFVPRERLTELLTLHRRVADVNAAAAAAS